MVQDPSMESEATHANCAQHRNSRPVHRNSRRAERRIDSNRGVATRCKAALALLVMMLCVSGNAIFTGAEEMESDQVSRVRILAAALATRGQWRVALRGRKPACSAWAEHGLPLRDSEGQTEQDAETSEAACEEVVTEVPAPELRRHRDEKTLPDTICHVDLVDDVSQPLQDNGDDGAAHPTPLAHSEDTVQVEVPALRAIPLRSDDDIPQNAMGYEDVCALDTQDANTEGQPVELRVGVEKHARGQDVHGTLKGGNLDKLFEHIEDDTMHHLPPPSPPSIQ